MATINIDQKDDYLLQIWNIFWYGSTWYNGSYILTGATDTTTGIHNSLSIYEQQGDGTYASSLCETSTDGSYTDWYLPSIEELEEIYALGGGAMGTTKTYWSSTEIDLNNAWAFNSATGLRVSANKNVNTYLSIMARQELTNLGVEYNRMSELRKNAPILNGGVNNADEDVYKMLGGINGISKNSKIMTNE
jgi:hypothetical protein